MLKLLFFVALCTHCRHLLHTNAEKFYTKNVGQLHLSEQKWEIKHVLNLTDYLETTEILKECIDTLNTICKNGSNPLCHYFQRAAGTINTEIESDKSKFKTLSREKRNIVGMPVFIGISNVALWTASTMKRSTIKSIRDEIRENLDLIEQAANFSTSSLHLMEEFAKENNPNMWKIHNAINNNTKNLDSLTRFFNIINVVSFSVQLHEKMQVKLNDIYYGDIESRLFEIIDFQEFSNTVESINEMLAPNLTLPNILTMSRNKLIKTYTDYNHTHLTLSVDLPVIHKRGFDIYEIVPLPIEKNGKVYILDMPTTTFYKNGSRITLFPEKKSKDILCKTQDKLTVCNSFLEDYSINASKCIYNLHNENSSDIECTYREIPKQNYFIKLTDGILYAHLIYPIKVVNDCRG